MSNFKLEKIPILINFKEVQARGDLIRILAPHTIEALVSQMPITSRTFIWKEEVYFETPVSVGPEKPKSGLRAGDLAYWPPGKSFCIFYGKSQPYSPVNVIGRITSDLESIRNVREGEWVTLRLFE